MPIYENEDKDDDEDEDEAVVTPLEDCWKPGDKDEDEKDIPEPEKVDLKGGNYLFRTLHGDLINAGPGKNKIYGDRKEPYS